jgi:hypothetical protein
MRDVLNTDRKGCRLFGLFKLVTPINGVTKSGFAVVIAE